MSKVALYVSAKRMAAEIRPEDFHRFSNGGYSAMRAYVSDNGDCNITECSLTPPEAVALAQWLIDKYGELVD